MPSGDRRAFTEAARELSTAYRSGANLCRPFVHVLPVEGASISTLGSLFGTETVCASDPRAARIDEIQFDLGEGPCWQALSTRRPVLAPDVRHPSNTDWPMFLRAIEETEIGGLFAFPLVLGALEIGAVDLYCIGRGTLTSAQISDAVALAGLAARQVLRRALLSHPLPAGVEEDPGYSRRVVHQATGMVLAQLDLPASDAVLILHGYAFSHGRSVADVAADVVARKINFKSESDLP